MKALNNLPFHHGEMRPALYFGFVCAFSVDISGLLPKGDATPCSPPVVLTILHNGIPELLHRLFEKCKLFSNSIIPEYEDLFNFYGNYF